MKQLSLLGSTGSIGCATLDIVRTHSDRFQIISLSAGKNLERLRKQIREFSPALVSVQEEADAQMLSKEFSGLKVLWGEDGAVEAARMNDADIVLVAFVGAAGLKPCMSALESGKTLALANKESMVIAGELMRQTAKRTNAAILPVDSEHSAIFQCLNGEKQQEVQRIILTASGGPFFKREASTFDTITREEALNHPTWTMGDKITIDSATMMNKGLEVLEARWLFDIEAQKISIVIHPQSVVHSMVEYRDGSFLAHLGRTDMRIPIQYALSYPERLSSPCEPFDLVEASPLEFHKPDFEKFPSLRLAYGSLKEGGTAPAILNAANEVAVQAFLDGELSFPAISQVAENCLSKIPAVPADSLESIMEADRKARITAVELI